MKTWTITQARAQIADVFDAAMARGPQRIARRDRGSVVMVAEADWMRLVAEYPTFADLIVKAPFDAGDTPARRPARVLGEDGA